MSYSPDIFNDDLKNMSQSVGVPDGIRAHHFREYESRTQCVWLESYKASHLYWDVPGSNLGRGINYADRGIYGFVATVHANNGINTK
jgi:hypothetical protein